ncbi:hypothetical protein GON26_12515 [Flavobacterium sp. GA093]|uniref:Uncharacterized protein n=1 Tax=Flavobacterium hydrocarbonoxydans TaxID=2683249 RepID=A0A6I4NLC7_9FLAO|nr:hypothetical protein [Flavobacterium hydrocarbonoxydans]MWB95186.1 hypothetical protein [Flavobacterium hydrocarbonoxydans]
MSKNKNQFGCLVIIFVFVLFIVLYNIIESSFSKKENKLADKEANEKTFKKYWNNSNILFFKTFNCNDLKKIEAKPIIKKVFIIETFHKELCNPQQALKFHYIFPEKKYSSKITDSIINANILIWINEIEEIEEGKYTNGTIAKRRQLMLSFIDLSQKTIYKTQIIKFDGEPEPEIKVRRNTKSKEINFGEYPREKIVEIIKNLLDE